MLAKLTRLNLRLFHVQQGGEEQEFKELKAEIHEPSDELKGELKSEIKPDSENKSESEQ